MLVSLLYCFFLFCLPQNSQIREIGEKNLKKTQRQILNSAKETQTMKKILALLFSVMLVIGMTGCSEPTLLDPNNPVTLSLWHVYGEQADSPMNQLIAEFNATVGLEKGIVVTVTNVTNTSKIGGQLKSAMEGEPGAAEMPDLFSVHTSHAGLLGAENLGDWNEWFSE